MKFLPHANILIYMRQFPFSFILSISILTAPLFLCVSLDDFKALVEQEEVRF